MQSDGLFNRMRGLFWGTVVAVWLWPGWGLAQKPEKAAEAAPSGDSGPLPEWAEFLDAILELNVGQIPVWRIVVAGLLIVAGLALRRFLLDRLLQPIRNLLDRTETEYDDRILRAIYRPGGWLINLIALYFAVLILQLPGALTRVASLLLQTIGTGLVAWMVHNLIEVGVRVLHSFARGTESEVDDYLVPVVGRVLRVGLYALVLVAIIQQWGYDVTSLLAGLGIGGLAFALAAKPTLSNWFGSLMIFTDRPFNIGDRIEIDAGNGVVEEVGLRSTRIRTREDSLISIPNAQIASTDIENLSARRKRRIQLDVGLVYGTSADQLREIVDGIETLIEDHTEVDEESAIVRFNEFADSALVIFVDCYAQTTDREEYFRIREDVLFGVADVVEDAGSSFAFPSRSIYFRNELDVPSRDD